MSALRPSTLSRRSTPLWLLLVALGCSTSPGGPEYAELAVDSLTSTGERLIGECTPLPVLPGGTVERDFELAPGVSAHVLAVRDYADVTLRTGDGVVSHQHVLQVNLRDGYSESTPVTGSDGKQYTLVVVSPCVTRDAGADGG